MNYELTLTLQKAPKPLTLHFYLLQLNSNLSIHNSQLLAILPASIAPDPAIASTFPVARDPSRIRSRTSCPVPWNPLPFPSPVSPVSGSPDGFRIGSWSVDLNSRGRRTHPDNDRITCKKRKSDPAYHQEQANQATSSTHGHSSLS